MPQKTYFDCTEICSLSVKVRMIQQVLIVISEAFISPVLLCQTGCLSVSAKQVWPVFPPPSCPVPPSAVRGWYAVLGSVPNVSLFPQTSDNHQTSLSIQQLHKTSVSKTCSTHQALPDSGWIFL